MESFINFEACQDDQLNLTEADGRHYHSTGEEEIVSPEKPNEFSWIVDDDVFEDGPSFYWAMSLSKELEWEKNLDRQLSKRKEESKMSSASASKTKKTKRVLRIPSEEEGGEETRVGEEETATVESGGGSNDDNDADIDANSPVVSTKKKKKDNTVGPFDLSKAVFNAPISFQEDAEEDPEDEILCSLCTAPLRVGMSTTGKEYMMCINNDTCNIQWVPFADTPAFHCLISEVVLPIFKYPHPPTRCKEHMMPCKLTWARNTANQALHNQMFWVCDAKREDGAMCKCAFILCATEENKNEAKKKSTAYFREVENKKKADAKAKKRAKYNYNNADINLQTGGGRYMYRNPKEAATERSLARKEERLRLKATQAC